MVFTWKLLRKNGLSIDRCWKLLQDIDFHQDHLNSSYIQHSSLKQNFMFSYREQTWQATQSYSQILSIELSPKDSIQSLKYFAKISVHQEICRVMRILPFKRTYSLEKRPNQPIKGTKNQTCGVEQNDKKISLVKVWEYRWNHNYFSVLVTWVAATISNVSAQLFSKSAMLGWDATPCFWPYPYFKPSFHNAVKRY